MIWKMSKNTAIKFNSFQFDDFPPKVAFSQPAAAPLAALICIFAKIRNIFAIFLQEHDMENGKEYSHQV